MRLTIVAEDQLTIVDGKSQHFDLSPYDLPKNFWALQWQTDSGHIEFNLNQFSAAPEPIDSLPDWTEPILTEHKRITEEQEAEKEIMDHQSLFYGNGQARKDRIQHQRLLRQQQKQRIINQFVKEQMP